MSRQRNMASRINRDEVETRAKITDEIGATGLSIVWGHVEETYLRELRYPEAAAKYNEMLRRDPTLASLDVAMKLLARTARWSVVPGGNSDADKQAADFMLQAMDDMSHSFDDHIEDALSCVPYGWSYFEIVYKRRDGYQPDDNPQPSSSFDDGRIGWRKFAIRKQSSLDHWEFDDAGGLRGMWQRVPASRQTLRFIPIEKSLLYNGRRDAGNPEGLSFFEPIYESWHFVKNLAIIQGIGFERSFVGLPYFGYKTRPSPSDESMVESVGQALRVGSKAYVAIPENVISFDLKTVTHTNATSILDTIKYYRELMLMTVLAQFLALGLNGVGSLALGRDQSTLFLMCIDGLLDKVAAVLNRFAVPRLFRYNDFGTLTAYPQITHTTVQKPNLPELASYLSALNPYILPLVNDPAGVTIVNQLLEHAGLPPVVKDKAADTTETGTEVGLTRGDQGYFLSEWNRLRDEFYAAMGKNG
jgi:hypothetical protein